MLEEGRSAKKIAEELGISSGGLFGWIKRARIDRGEGPKDALTTEELEAMHFVCSFEKLGSVVCHSAVVDDDGGEGGGAGRGTVNDVVHPAGVFPCQASSIHEPSRPLWTVRKGPLRSKPAKPLPSWKTSTLPISTGFVGGAKSTKVTTPETP